MPDTERKLSHAVHATGKSTPLPGGRSRFTQNGVPILELRDDLADAVSESTRKFLDPNQETEHLVGVRVVLHNPSPQPGVGVDANDDTVVFNIGGETLDEAAKSVIGYFESQMGAAPPTWVESTNSLLAEVIADHYHGVCENRSAKND